MVLTFVILLTLFSGIIAKNEFPQFIRPCKKSEDLNKCILENIEICKPRLKSGIPKLFIPPLNPLVLPLVSMKSAGLNIELKNFMLYKMDDFNITEFNFDPERNVFHMAVMFNYMEGKNDYSIVGKLMIFQLNGTGKIEGNITKLFTTFDVNLGKELDNGKEHFIIKDTKIKYDLQGNVSVYFHNLFGKNEELTRQTMKVFNDNSKELFNETSVIVDSAIQVFIDITFTRFFKKYSVNEIISE